MTIGERLRATLSLKKLKQSDLAKALSVSESTVQKWITDKNHIPADKIPDLCNWLSICPSRILGTSTSIDDAMFRILCGYCDYVFRAHNLDFELEYYDDDPFYSDYDRYIYYFYSESESDCWNVFHLNAYIDVLAIYILIQNQLCHNKHLTDNEKEILNESLDDIRKSGLQTPFDRDIINDEKKSENPIAFPTSQSLKTNTMYCWLSYENIKQQQQCYLKWIENGHIQDTVDNLIPYMHRTNIVKKFIPELFYDTDEDDVEITIEHFRLEFSQIVECWLEYNGLFTNFEPYTNNVKLEEKPHDYIYEIQTNGMLIKTIPTIVQTDIKNKMSFPDYIEYKEQEEYRRHLEYRKEMELEFQAMEKIIGKNMNDMNHYEQNYADAILKKINEKFMNEMKEHQECKEQLVQKYNPLVMPSETLSKLVESIRIELIEEKKQEIASLSDEDLKMIYEVVGNQENNLILPYGYKNELIRRGIQV